MFQSMRSPNLMGKLRISRDTFGAKLETTRTKIKAKCNLIFMIVRPYFESDLGGFDKIKSKIECQ